MNDGIDLDQEFEALIQERDGWPGIRDLLINWLPFVISTEGRTTLRLHRSTQLRRILTRFLDEAPKVFLFFVFSGQKRR